MTPPNIRVGRDLENGQLKGRVLPRARVKIIILHSTCLQLEQPVHVYVLSCLECTFRTARGNRLRNHLRKKQPRSSKRSLSGTSGCLEQAGAKTIPIRTLKCSFCNTNELRRDILSDVTTDILSIESLVFIPLTWISRVGYACLIEIFLMMQPQGYRYSLSWKFNLCSNRDILSGSITDGDILGDVATKFY